MSDTRFTLPDPGGIVYNKEKIGTRYDETLILDVRPDSAAEDVVISEESGLTVADVCPRYYTRAPVAEVARVDRIVNAVGEGWSVEDVRPAAAEDELSIEYRPVTMFTTERGEQGSELYQEIRQRTKDVDGIGPATTEDIATEFDGLADIERAVDAFPDTAARLRFERCRKAPHADATFDIYYALQEAVGAAGGDDQ
jgi:hypothetical protein